MSVLQVSERIIKENFQTLDDKDNIKLSHNESNLYYNNDLVYKIFKPMFRYEKEKNIYLLKNKVFPHANNIIDVLYQGDKLIGITYKYLDNFETMKTYMNKLSLYEIKEVMDLIVEKNIFAPNGADLVDTVEAKIVVTDTTEYDLAI